MKTSYDTMQFIKYQANCKHISVLVSVPREEEVDQQNAGKILDEIPRTNL